MTDQNTSGAQDAPAAENQAASAGAATTAGTFGSSRGSGLARGKRQTGASAPTTGQAKSEYKPTALEVIAPPSEYRNPFASPEPENAPADQPAKVEAPQAPVAEVQAVPPVQPAIQPAEQPSQASAPERREISILPPAEAARPSTSWESSRREDRVERRPSFRPERREDAQYGQRREGEPRRDGEHRHDGRDRRRDFERQPRDDRPQQAAPAAEAPKGFIGWLKSLFGGAKAPAAEPVREQGGDHQHQGGGRRRRHRGGRGRGPGGGGPQGFRNDRPYQGGEGEGRGDHQHQGGGRRRRHRGGRGRDQGEPRPEGHQGGGAI